MSLLLLPSCNNWVVENPDTVKTGDSIIVSNDTVVIGSDTVVIHPDTISVVSSDSAYVYVTFSASSATVVATDKAQPYITVYSDGAHVALYQSESVSAAAPGEITYVLSGSSSDGSFYLDGQFKCTVLLNSLALQCADSAAVNIHNGKRINLQIEGTNTLSDSKNGSQKACLVIKGHPEVTGSGTLTLTGNTKHALKTGEYMQLKNKFTGSIIVKSAVGDGLHIGQYLEMNNGTLTVLNAGDDGIQIEKTDDTTDEQNGFAIINGGNINATVSADAGKGLKSDSTMTIAGGAFTITTTGGGITGTNDTTSACACIKSGADLTINGGTFTLKSTGSGGKGISADGDLVVNDGNITITTTGTRYSASSSSSGGGWGGGWGGGSSSSASYKRSSPKGIKADGDVTINGGTINVSATGSGDGSEGIESKKVLTVNGGDITVYSYDDAINSSSHMYIKNGIISVIATNNDGLDANGNLYIQGGTTMAFGGASPECGLDAAERYYLYITGGNVLAVGGGNNSVSSTSGSQGVVSTTGSVTANTTVKITAQNSSTALATFTIPGNYTSPSQGGGRVVSAGPGGGGWGGGSSNMSILISADGMTSGSKYDVYNNSSSSTTLTASNTYSGR
ncbi:MAG: carbohydrate-binding domain-containing protein [Paludibacteraceae bacterium]|nr:carbohydrate-binding domain-containing protein [Paludibacteraceae bacterium]